MLLLLLFLAQLAQALLPDCRAGTLPSVAPDLTTRCDRTLSCDYCQRNAISWDFLCCEDQFGWIPAHAITPMLITLYFQDIRWTLIAIIWFEPFEQLWFSLTSTGATINQNIETLFGSELGDAVIQGGSGLWLGVLLLYIFDLPLLTSTSYRVDKLARLKYGSNPRCTNSVRWKRYKYLIFAGIHIGLIYLIGFHNDSGTINYGLYINAGLQALIFFVLYPWVLYTDRENDLVWNADFDANPYPRRMRNWFFYTTGTIILTLQMSAGGWEYMANDWFQVWCTQAGILTVLTIVAIVIAAQRRDPYMIAAWSAAYAIGWAVGLFITSRVLEQNAYAWAALGLLLAALLTIAITEFRLKRRRPFNTNYSRRLEKPEKPRSLLAHFQTKHQ
jgi:hypothetical protein